MTILSINNHPFAKYFNDYRCLEIRYAIDVIPKRYESYMIQDQVVLFYLFQICKPVVDVNFE